MTETKPTTADSPTSLMDESTEEPTSDCETPVTPSKGNEQEAAAATKSTKESPETPGEKEEEKKEQQADEKTPDENEKAAADAKEKAAADEKEKAAADAKAKAEAEAKRKEKYKDWPMKNIVEPHENDVLYGRGGEFNELVLRVCDVICRFCLILIVRNVYVSVLLRRNEPSHGKQALSSNG